MVREPGLRSCRARLLDLTWLTRPVLRLGSSLRDLLDCLPARAVHARVPDAAGLWVPKTSSTSRDQVIFVDRAAGASLPSDAVLLKIDGFGWWFQRGSGV